MIKHFNKHFLQISWIWLPYLILLPYVPIGKIVAFVFLMLSIHEMAHVLCAFLLGYHPRKIIIYPFGFAAQIPDIGMGSVYKEIIILAAGPLTHVFFPYLISQCVYWGWISSPFATYLYMMNASLLVFNLLPIYPLDGGRIMQAFFHCLLPFQKANKMTILCSGLFLFILISMSILNGFSAYIMLTFLFLQLFIAYRELSYTTLKFYHYRYAQTPSYSPLFHEKKDLYRMRYNVMKAKKGWLKEEQWLHMKFFQNRSRR